MEEYRVELAAIEMGHASAAARRDSLSENLDEFRQLLRDAVAPPRRMDDEQGMLRDGYRIFIELAHEIAWLVAADVATEGTLVPDRTGASWERLVGDHYQSMRDALSAIPSASVPTPRSGLEEQASALIRVVADWFKFIGFITGDDGHGGPMMGLVRTDF